MKSLLLKIFSFGKSLSAFLCEAICILYNFLEITMTHVSFANTCQILFITTHITLMRNFNQFKRVEPMVFPNCSPCGAGVHRSVSCF